MIQIKFGLNSARLRPASRTATRKLRRNPREDSWTVTTSVGQNARGRSGFRCPMGYLALLLRCLALSDAQKNRADGLFAVLRW